MKILNLNLFFYPESIGGATVVAEKMAWGLQQGGHDVTSVYLPRNPAPADFTVRETPFGRSVGMRNSPHSPANRFVNPAATSTLHELVEVLRPDRIVVHAVQHMGVQRLLADPVLRAKTILVVHDFYWMCLQGFRNLPDGSNCNLRPNGANCRQCAWFPGLTDSIYAASREILSGVRAAVFPSQFLHDSYVQLLGERYDNFVVQANPDKAETIIPDPAVLPPAPGAAARAAGKTVLGFVGGPGETKGWELVRAFMQRAKADAARADGVHMVLYDVGRSINTPWYPGMQQPGITIADAFHWSFAGHAMGQLDTLLMPSRVRESFGLAAREILSLGGSALVRRSGALAELEGYAGVVTAEDGDSVDDLLDRLVNSSGPDRRDWPVTSIPDYVERLLSL